MRMDARRRSGPGYDVVIGPCPGCDAWQLDYTDEVATSYAPSSVDDGDRSAFYRVVEQVLGEHLAECPHLADLIILDGQL